MTVNVAISAADNSGTAPTVAFVSATSNEPDNAPGDADGNTTGDIVRVDLDTFRRDYVADRTRGILPGMPRLVQAGFVQVF